MMQITLKHQSSKFGIPAVLVSGKVIPFGDAVKMFRAMYKLSVKEMAEMTDKSPRTIEKYESGKTSPAASVLNVMMLKLEDNPVR